MLEIPWLNTIVSAFTLLVLFLVVFYTRWQQALPLALILVTLCVICEFTPPLIMSALIGNNLAQTIEITIDAAAFNLIASGIFYIVLRVGRFILNRIYGEKTPIYTKNNGWASIFPIVSIVFVYYIVYMGAVANTSQTTMMGGILYAFILISNICLKILIFINLYFNHLGSHFVPGWFLFVEGQAKLRTMPNSRNYETVAMRRSIKI